MSRFSKPLRGSTANPLPVETKSVPLSYKYETTFKQAPPPAKPKPAAKRKPKKVEYVIHIQNTAPVTVESTKGFNILRDGFHHGDVWYAPYQIIKIERRP